MDDNIINASDEFRRRQTAAKFARLLGLAADREEAILADPIPYLSDMAGRFERLLRSVDEALSELDGRLKRPPIASDGPVWESPGGVAMDRNKAARDLLENARKAARQPMAQKEGK